MKINLLASIAVLAIGASSLLAHATQTLTGTISDAMCGAHHMMKDATDAQCTRECIKRGAGYALVTADKVYTLKGDKTRLDKFAGQSVVVKGTVDGTTVTAASVSPAKAQK
jgi:hypothetical protein